MNTEEELEFIKAEIQEWVTANREEVNEIINGEGSTEDKAMLLFQLYQDDDSRVIEVTEFDQEVIDNLTLEGFLDFINEEINRTNESVINRDSAINTDSENWAPTPAEQVAAAGTPDNATSNNATGNGGGMRIGGGSMNFHTGKYIGNPLFKITDALSDKMTKGQSDIFNSFKGSCATAQALEDAMDLYEAGKCSKDYISRIVRDNAIFVKQARSNSIRNKTMRKLKNPELANTMKQIGEEAQSSMKNSRDKMSRFSELNDELGTLKRSISIFSRVMSFLGSICRKIFSFGRNRSAAPAPQAQAA